MLYRSTAVRKGEDKRHCTGGGGDNQFSTPPRLGREAERDRPGISGDPLSHRERLRDAVRRRQVKV